MTDVQHDTKLSFVIYHFRFLCLYLNRAALICMRETSWKADRYEQVQTDRRSQVKVQATVKGVKGVQVSALWVENV